MDRTKPSGDSGWQIIFEIDSVGGKYVCNPLAPVSYIYINIYIYSWNSSVFSGRFERKNQRGHERTSMFSAGNVR